MNLSELQIKDIVNVLDGKNLGKIVDAEINKEGQVVHFIVERKRFFWRWFSSQSAVNISMSNIERIGEDVILVKI